MKLFIFVFVSLLLEVVYGQAPQQVSCVTGDVSRNGEFCLLTNINTVSNFKPVFGNNAAKVKEFEIRNSTVKHLGPEICLAFPNIEKFTASEVGIETLDKDTFKNCQNLQEIRILRNNIKMFDRDLFNRNSNLKLLYFGINQLTSLPREIFRNLNKLEDLGFASMTFTVFPQEVFKDLQNLKVLWVYHDALLDLDAEDILRYMPRLEKVYLRDNDFKCSRLQVILDAFKQRNVFIDKTIWEGNERKRDYNVSQVEGVECIPDGIYEEVTRGRFEPVGNRFDDKLGSAPAGGVERQIMLLREAFEYKINEMKTAHKAEMDDLKRQLSVMHQNLDQKMTIMLSKVEGWGNHQRYHHGGEHGGHNWSKGSQ